jgi:hypothetical protein
MSQFSPERLRQRGRTRNALFGLALSAGLCVCADATWAQDGWPYDQWNETPRKEAPEATPGQPLQPFDQAPDFDDPRRGTSRPYPYPGQSSPSGGYSNNSPSFAAPVDVERADLTPLEPVESGVAPGGLPGRDPSPYPQPGDGAASRPGGYTPASHAVSNEPSQTPSAGGLDRIDPQIAATHLKALEGPPKSRTLRDLLARVLEGNQTPAGPGGAVLAAERLKAQMRLGFIAEAARSTIPAELGRQGPDWAGFALRRAQAQAALGDGGAACRDARDIVAAADGMPDKDKDLAILLSGYCGAQSKTKAAVTLAADVARERTGFDPAGLAGLEAFAHDAKPHIPASLKLSPIAYRLLLMAGADPAQLVTAKADAALLVAMTDDRELPASLRVEAAERAAAAFLISPKQLADAYRATHGGADIETMQSGRDADTGGPSLRRAGLYAAAVGQPTPLRKVRLVRAFLDSSSRSGLYLPALEVMAEPVSQLRPVEEIGWFAETAVETLLLAGRIEEARQWLQLSDAADPRGPGALAHWAALVDIADATRSAKRGESLQSLEHMALRGDFRPVDLHRLATVLDALDYNVPISLWEAASRTPQPNDGHLPATGVLSELQKASKSGDSARTILLVLEAIGPDGPTGAHMISLGDSIRALKRIGMEREARRIGLEALFPTWPRSAQG